MEQRFHIGNDGWDQVSIYLQQKKISSVLLITGKSMYATSGAEANLGPILKGKRVQHLFDFETNPKTDDVRRLLGSISRDAPYDAILAVGGGSVLDVAKLLKAFGSSNDPVLAHLAGDEALEPSNIKLIAIPSTAGSGSEATPFAVVYREKTKFSIMHEKLRPDFAVIIPSLLKSLPQHVAASSGMDALCQAIESYWSIHSTIESRGLAKQAMTLASTALKHAILDKEAGALEDLARASYLAGKAISITKTTAPHAVSYALTSFYGISHGHAVGLLIPSFLNYNLAVTDKDCLDPRGKKRVITSLGEIANALGYSNVLDASNGILKLTQRLGLETDLQKLGIKHGRDIDTIVENGFNPQRVNNNPRLLTNEGLRSILEEMIKLKAE